MILADSHCHLTDRAFGGEVVAAIERANQAGVARAITIASGVEDSHAALELADSHPGFLWCTVGVHPHAVAQGDADEDMDSLRSLTRHCRCVAIGETGLDYYYNHVARVAQRRYFERHLALAAELSMPVVVHAREAAEDVAAAIRRWGDRVRGVLHCFTGPLELMTLALDHGWFVSFTGIVTFKGFDTELVRRTPADRYMVETDSPYLAPIPKRGRRNEPAFVGHVADRIASIRGESRARVAADTWANTARFFGLPEEA